MDRIPLPRSGALSVSALEELKVAGTGARFWVDACEIVLEIWILS